MILINPSASSRPRYHCCGSEGAHLHHKLTRARGGLLLDAVGETYHQMYLCPEHHAIAHDAPAFDNGLLIRGYVMSGASGAPYYTGPDEYLTEKYGIEQLSKTGKVVLG